LGRFDDFDSPESELNENVMARVVIPPTLLHATLLYRSLKKNGASSREFCDPSINHVTLCCMFCVVGCFEIWLCAELLMYVVLWRAVVCTVVLAVLVVVWFSGVVFFISMNRSADYFIKSK
jgi:hypothetical protein